MEASLFSQRANENYHCSENSYQLGKKYINISHCIVLPPDYRPDLQKVKLKIKPPEILFVDKKHLLDNEKSLPKCQKYVQNIDDDDNTSEIVQNLVLDEYEDALHIILKKSNRRKRITAEKNMADTLSVSKYCDSKIRFEEVSTPDEESGFESRTSDLDENRDGDARSILHPSNIASEKPRRLRRSSSYDYLAGSSSGTSTTNEINENSPMTIGRIGCRKPRRINCDYELKTSNSSDSDITSGTSGIDNPRWSRFYASNFSLNLSSASSPNLSNLYHSISSLNYFDKEGEHSVENYETLGEEIDDGGAKTKPEILVQGLNKQVTAISQITKALNCCESTKDFQESIQRIEVERVFLLESLRKRSIIEEMSKIGEGNDVPTGDSHRKVHILNIKVPLVWTVPNNPKFTRFFVVIFQHELTLCASDLLVPNENKVLDIKKGFCFENLPANFEINFYIYSIFAKIENKNSGKFFKDCTQRLSNLKKLLSSRRQPNQQPNNSNVTRYPSFILYSRGVIKNSSATGEFIVENVFERLPVANILCCDIDITQN